MGLFDSTEQAESVVRDLQSAGFSTGDVSVILPDPHARDLEHTTRTGEGGAAGIGAGGALAEQARVRSVLARRGARGLPAVAETP